MNLAPPYLIDTHCHLDRLKSLDTATLLLNAKSLQLGAYLTIATGPDDLDLVLDLAKNHPQVYATQGVHPHDAKLFTDDTAAKIIENVKHPKIVAIGEIGLDYHYLHSDKDTQMNVFEEQLKIASTHNLPVVIHSREADLDTVAILSKYPVKGVIHSFSSSNDLLSGALDLGFYFGINGIVTFKGSQLLREQLKKIPLDRLILETDSPFLAPVPHRGKENTPLNLPIIAKFIALELNIDYQTLISVVYRNTLNLFGGLSC